VKYVTLYAKTLEYDLISTNEDKTD